MKGKDGRNTVMTPECIKILEEAYMMDCTDAEACLMAGIATPTLYKYQKEHPEFVERKQELKQTPFLKARRTLVKGIEESFGNAMDYMKRKKKDEFSERQEFQGKMEVKQITGMNIIEDAATVQNENQETD